MATLRPDPSFYPSPRMASKAAPETVAYVAAFDPNRKTLEAFLTFAYEQGVAHRKVALDEVFPPSVQHILKV